MELQLIVPKQEIVFAHLEIHIMDLPVFMDAVLMKFWIMESVAAKLATILLMEFVDNVHGIKFMIKDLDFAEYHAIHNKYIPYSIQHAFAYLNIIY